MDRQRINVIGVSGVGKSAFALALSRRLRLPYIESDAFHWEPGWTPAPKPLRRARIAAAIVADAWVLDGNMEFARDLVWPRANTLMWLDYSLPVVLTRVCRRNLRLAWTHRELWNGNHMTWPFALSGIQHAITSYGKKRASFAHHLAVYPHLQVFRFQSPHQARYWLEHEELHA